MGFQAVEFFNFGFRGCGVGQQIVGSFRSFLISFPLRVKYPSMIQVAPL